MPTIANAPRSSGGRTVGRVADAPRSSGTPRSAPPAPRTGEEAILSIKGAKPADAGRAPLTPLRFALRAASVPALGVGEAIRDPGTLLQRRSGIDLFRDRNANLPGQALRGRGFLPGGKAGIALGLAADIALDPLTYVSFGAGAAVKGGARAAIGREAARQIDDIVKSGGRPTLAQTAKASATTAAERAAAPRSVKVSLRVPFTRNKEILLGESEGLSAAVKRLSDKIAKPEVKASIRRGVTPDRGVTPVVNEVFNDLRRAAANEMKRIADSATRLDRDVAKLEDTLKLGRGKGREVIARHLDNPDRYPVPEGLEEVATRGRTILDDFNRAEKDAGIEYGDVEHYVPHMGANPKDRRKIAEVFAKPTASTIDEPFFVKPREAKNLDEFEAIGREQGFTPELNIARLIERRGRASVNTRMKKALDDAIYERFGTTVPDVSPDEAFEEWLGLTTAKKYHKEESLTPEVADGLARVHARITPLVKDDDALQRTSDGVRRLTSRWKALALLSPGYQIRNLYDDGLRAYWAGARNPHSFTQASKLLTTRGKAGELKGIRIGDETWTREELLRRAEANGVIDTGFVRSETESLDEAVRGKGPAGPGRGPLVRGAQVVGDYRENVTRLGTWIELLKKGEEPGEAARTVREFLFDYSEVGKAVEVARSTFIPFITFPSKSIPFTIREFARRPGRAANFEKVITASNELAGNPDLSLLPTGSQASFGAPVPGWLRTAVNAPQDQAMLVNPERLFAMGSLNLLNPQRDAARSNAFGLLTPMARIPLEVLTESNLGYGTPFPRAGSRAPAFVNQLAQRGVPIPGHNPNRKDSMTGARQPGYSPTLNTLLRGIPIFGQADQVTGGSSGANLGLARYLFGIPVSPYDAAREGYFRRKYPDR